MPDGGSSLEEVNDEGTFELSLQGGVQHTRSIGQTRAGLKRKDGHAAMGCICRERPMSWPGMGWIGLVPRVMSWWRGDLDGTGERIGLDPVRHRLSG